MSVAGRREAGIRVAVLAALVAATASGCVSLQVSGPITQVKDEDAGASKVQIWPSPPSADEKPAGIVSGFLEAARSGAANEKTAAAYLTGDAKKTWQTEQNTVIVLADYSEGGPQAPGSESQNLPGGDGTDLDGAGSGAEADPATTIVQVQGTMLGELSADGFYSARSSQVTYQFTVSFTPGQGYRISALPAGDFGVLMERSDFESSYTRHEVYFQNPQLQNDLVPTQVYLPVLDTDRQVAAQVARIVVDGAPGTLTPALQDSVPGAGFQSLQLDGDGQATVTIDSNGACSKSPSPCGPLAQQLAQTLSAALGAKLSSVVVSDKSTGMLTPPYAPNPQLADYSTGQSGQRTEPGRPVYAISPTGMLEQVSTSGSVTATTIAFGADKTRFTSVAVAPGQANGNASPQFALVGQDGKVYLARRQGGSSVLDPIFPTSATPVGGKVGRLGWDDEGALWFTDELNGAVSVYRYSGGSLTQVTVTNLDAGDQLSQVAPAPDGDRVAVEYTDADGNYWIAIAAAVPEAVGTYSMDLSRREVVASSWNSITEFDWYSEDSLAVLGNQPSSQQAGLYQLYADGSAVYDSLIPQPVQASPPSQATGFVWSLGGQPIAVADVQGKPTLFTLSVEGQDAQALVNSSGYLTGTSPSY